ncbi:MAG: hypothetical protein H6977_02070 [Gammaproteobacteria bacterium]|nr:hypothetical protein [Gammaproteobacteria bacterium]MCP5198769.1 hypothetical protein [Gammaproteobacteria bacterium]
MSGDDRAGRAASPPCGLADAPAAWSGFADRAEIRVLLAELLAAERAGAAALYRLCLPQCPPADRATLVELARDEARCAAMLVRQSRRYGGDVRVPRGAFYERMAALEDYAGRIALLERGQAWVARRLAAALPRIGDGVLRRDLAWMHDLHELNITRGRLLAGP